jgi:hypothetical protein
MDKAGPPKVLSAIVVDEDMNAAVKLGRLLRSLGVQVAAVTDVVSIGRALLLMESELLFLAVRPELTDKIAEIGREAAELQIAVVLTGEISDEALKRLAIAVPGAQRLTQPTTSGELTRILSAARRTLPP